MTEPRGNRALKRGPRTNNPRGKEIAKSHQEFIREQQSKRGQEAKRGGGGTRAQRARLSRIDVGDASSKALARLQKVKKAAGTLPKGQPSIRDIHNQIFAGSSKKKKTAKLTQIIGGALLKKGLRKAQLPGMEEALKQKAKKRSTLTPKDKAQAQMRRNRRKKGK
jgi:hypothetical protein